MITGTFVPVGQDSNNYMIYAKSELDSDGNQWYFHYRDALEVWAFTWDTHLTTAMIDFNDVGNGKFTSNGFLK